MSLTPKQEAFCQAYVASLNGAQAYRSAYAVGEMTKDASVNVAASKLLADPKISQRIDVLQHQADAAAAATRDPATSVGTLTWALDRLTGIATADPRELIGLRVGACRHCHGAGHAYHWRQREYLEALAVAERSPVPVPLPDCSGGLDFNATRPPHPDCPECHGEGIERVVPRDTDKLSDQALLLYGGVKRKRDGSIEIVMADRTKALELAVRMLGGFTDNVRLGGTIGQLTKIITNDMTAEEAAQAYREMNAAMAPK